MNLEQNVERILKAVRLNQFTLRDHAASRSRERAVSRQNVINVANSVIDWKWQETQQTFWIIGFLHEGQPGGFTAAFDNGVWIVTVFKRKLTRREKDLIK